MSTDPKRLVSEYTPERGYVVREETEADRALFDFLRAQAEKRASEPSRGWSIPVGPHVYAALKRLEAKRKPPRPGYTLVFDDAWGPYRAGRR